MNTGNLLLAVDGGGTKTQALIADFEGKVLARGLGPSSNIHNVGLQEACLAVATAVEGALLHVLGPQARREGGAVWKGHPFASACLGLAGVDDPRDEAAVGRWVKDVGLASRFVVVNDSELVLAGGTPHGWGVAVISGTGSVCLGRTAEGKTARVGGWGPLIGDEGSGYHIAVNALRLATQSADGRAHADGLLNAILHEWKLPDPTSLIRFVHSPETTTAAISGLATVVLDLASRGDAAAKGVVEGAAHDLARHVETVVKTLKMVHPPLALGGGLLRGQLRHALVAAVGETGPVQYVADPSVGAVVLARRLLSQAGA
jgi:N-acetylglucosamine kinase-like BadF-type ATPase